MLNKLSYAVTRLRTFCILGTWTGVAFELWLQNVRLRLRDDYDDAVDDDDDDNASGDDDDGFEWLSQSTVDPSYIQSNLDCTLPLWR